MVSPALAPTWNCAPAKEPSSRFTPLKVVWLATRSISETSWLTSACRASRSDCELVAFEDCTASSRMRCRLLVTSVSAPSAVWAREMPSLALRTAWFMPRICEVKRSEIARPAASSLALLMRSPEDRRSMEVASELCVAPMLRCAVRDITLVLIESMAKTPSSGLRPVCKPGQAGRWSGAQCAFDPDIGPTPPPLSRSCRVAA